MIIEILLAVLIAVLFILVAYYVFANRNFVLTFLAEGTTKMTMRGGTEDKPGEFDYALIGWAGHSFKGMKDKDIKGTKYWDVVKEEEPKSWFRKTFGGLRYFGIPPFQVIYTYRHKWTHLHENGEIVSHDETIDYALIKKDIYVIEIPLVEKEEKGKGEKGAEDIAGLPLGISVIMPMEIVNPYEALFSVKRWLPMITGIVQVKLRRFVASYRYREDLINMRAGEGIEKIQEDAGVPEDSRDEPGIDLWDKFWGELKEQFKKEGGIIEENQIRICGVKIFGDEAGILKIDPSAKYRELTIREYEAEQNKKRTIIEAEAEKERLKTVGEGESQRIGIVYSEIKRFGDLGQLIRTLESVEKSPLAASLTVQAIPGLPEVFRGIFNKDVPSRISNEEIKKLKELLKKAGGDE